jgi:hypothetical protein
MLTISGIAFNTLTFGYFYDHFVRSYRMKNAERNKAIYRGRGDGATRVTSYQPLILKMSYAISVAVEHAECGQAVEEDADADSDEQGAEQAGEHLKDALVQASQ